MEMQNNNVAGVQTFWWVSSFWKCKTTMWRAFELLLGPTVFGNAKQKCGRRSNICWGSIVFGSAKQQSGWRSNFFGANSFRKCKTTMWQAFELLLGPTVFGSAKQQCGRRSKFCWGSAVFGNVKQQCGRRSNFLGGSSLFVNIKHFTFTFPKSVDLNKLPNFVFSFNLAITYETSGGE